MSMSRRSFLTAAAAIGGTVALGGLAGCSAGEEPEQGADQVQEPTQSQEEIVITPAIDIHHHYLPPEVVAAMQAQGLPTREWTVQADIEFCDQVGVGGALLAYPTTGVRTAEMIRAANEQAAAYSAESPERYGFLASLPCDDMAATLSEIDYAYDQLGADGFVLFSNYAGVNISDPANEAMLESLDSRGAVIHFHPNDPVNGLIYQRHASVYELPFETTRAAIELVFSGMKEKYPNIKWVLAHAGGTLPYLSHRFSLFYGTGLVDMEGEKVLELCRSFYFDTALSSSPQQMLALKEMLGGNLDHVIYGSDFPMRDAAGVATDMMTLKTTCNLTNEELEAICYGNAAKLFPRFAKAEA
ncbi:MAG: amidohydrolase family protein [Eggerthellaceae bacterium]|nr:amidohydrolase family protein [Eggerthellaceae bacterium]